MQFVQTPYFGITISIFAYWLGVKLQTKAKSVLCNSMILSVAFIIIILQIFGISYEDYYVGGYMIHTLLAPATACLGVSIYRQLPLLKKNLIPVLVGCIVGTFTSVFSVLALCKVFGLADDFTLGMLPKSVTTAIAAAIAQDQGGIVSIAVAAVAVSGISGNLLAPILSKWFRINDPLAEGLAIGACSHGLGTARALQIGETQGAMSGLAMGLCGVFTAIVALSFPYLV